jgi:outer membrane protein OmpA-like peptidoglycan-associated protein
MMRSFIAATLTAALLTILACRTAPIPAAGPLGLADPVVTSAALPPEIPAAQLAITAPPPASPETLDDAHLRQTDRGLLLTLEDATFDSERAIIRPAARQGLDRLAKFLQENPGRRVQIEAFTDDAGSSVYNLELSQNRADAVAMAVIDRGVDAARVRAIGWGERYPVAAGDTEEERQRNRRVEITVSKGDAAVPVRVVNAP